jgi:putative nucleotidyltransferase-like protein
MKPDQVGSANKQTENELIFWLLPKRSTDDVCQQIRLLLQKQLDWDYLLAIAHEHRITPLLHDRLKPVAEIVPAGFWDELTKRHYQIARSNFGLTTKLLKLLATLRDHHIPAIAYKGPALAQSAYGNISRRQFIDLDIMVRRQDVPKIKEVFLSIGCEPAWSLTAAQEAAVLRYYYEYPFHCNDRQVLIEVHWDFAEPFFSFAFDLDQMWQRLETIRLLEEPVQTLSAEDSLLVLCAHGSKHAWTRLGWVCDVAQLVSHRDDLNWDLVIKRANELGLLRMVRVGLQLATELAGLELPGAVADKMRSRPRLELIARQMGRQILVSTGRKAGTLRVTWLQLKIRERLRDKFKYCFRLIVMTKLIDSLFMPMGRPR